MMSIVRVGNTVWLRFEGELRIVCTMDVRFRRSERLKSGSVGLASFFGQTEVLEIEERGSENRAPWGSLRLPSKSCPSTQQI